jgi:Mrp family chromosome partitioning ATPase
LSGERVLLVDADLRKPNLHEFFGLSRAPGLVEALATGGAVSQFVQSVPGLIQIDLMSAGRPIPRTGDLAASERMRDLLRQACEDYDLVVIDSPPVLSVSDATGIASHTGVSVVLVAPQSSKRRVVKKALRSLEMVEADVAGIVVNRSGRLEKYSGY